VNQGNQPPFANAGGPYSVTSGSSVQLNGAQSSDANGSCGDSIVNYAWTIDGAIHLSGPNPALNTAVNALSAGSHPVSLQVTDSFGAIGTASTTVNVQAVLVSISVSPSAMTLSPGRTRRSRRSASSATEPLESCRPAMAAGRVEDRCGTSISRRESDSTPLRAV
jgi:hypothetical protein